MTPFARLLPVLVVAAGCGLSDPDDPPTAFQGAMDSVLPDRLVHGSAAAVTQFGNTEVGLTVSGLRPETEHGWHLRTGDCAGPGETVLARALYPSFRTDADGEGRAEAIFGESLDPGGPYAVEVFEGSVTEGLRVACGSLEPH